MCNLYMSSARYKFACQTQEASASPSLSCGSCVKYNSSTPYGEESLVISVFSVSDNFNLKCLGSIFLVNLPSETMASLRCSCNLVVKTVWHK